MLQYPGVSITTKSIRRYKTSHYFRQWVPTVPVKSLTVPAIYFTVKLLNSSRHCIPCKSGPDVVSLHCVNESLTVIKPANYIQWVRSTCTTGPVSRSYTANDITVKLLNIAFRLYIQGLLVSPQMSILL